MGSARARKSARPRRFSPAGLTIRPVSAWATSDGRYCSCRFGETERGGGAGAVGDDDGGGGGGGGGKRRFSNGPLIGGRGAAADEEAGGGEGDGGWAGMEQEVEGGEGGRGVQRRKMSGSVGGVSPGWGGSGMGGSEERADEGGEEEEEEEEEAVVVVARKRKERKDSVTDIIVRGETTAGRCLHR